MRGQLPLLVRLELFLQRGQFRERRIGVGLAATPLLRITPLARLAAAVAVLEIAPPLAARATILAGAIRALAAAAFTLLRAAFALFRLVAALAPIAAPMTRTIVAPLWSRLTALGWRRCSHGFARWCRRLCAIRWCRGHLRTWPAITALALPFSS